MYTSSDKSPVLITGADSETGYTTARALADLNVEVVGLYSNRRSRFCYSRYWHTLVHSKWDAESQLDTLFHYGKQSARRAVLFPTDDELVQFVSIHRDELSKYYDFVYPSAEVVKLLMDKTIFHGWASSHGFPVPKSYVAESHGDLDKILNRISYPVVIKPMFRTSGWLRKCAGHKVFMLRNKAAFSGIPFDMLEASSKLLIQEWIPGYDSDVHFCLMYIDRKGHERGYYTGKKLLQWPLLTGNTAVGKGTFNEELHQLARDVLLTAGLVGLGSLEVKKSDLDNRYLITEPTVGRNNYQSYVAVAGGINLTKIAYYDAIGRGHKINVGVMKKALWIDEFSTTSAIKYSLVHKNMESRNYKILLKESVCRRVAFVNMNLKDPKPFLHFCKAQLRSSWQALKVQLRGGKVKKF